MFGMAPLFVVFEGVDGAGKTTQIELLEEALRARGLSVLVTGVFRTQYGRDAGRNAVVWPLIRGGTHHFTFSIDGVSRVLTHQLVRHRVGVAYSQQSQRYAGVEEADCVVPRSIRSDEQLAVEVNIVIQTAMDLYRRLMAAGVPNEDARYVLPQAVATRLVMTVNLRALMQMYRLDACLRSQWEMRHLVNAMKREIRRISPRLASELKIKCFAQGYCDEATMCHELPGGMPRKYALFHAYQQYSQTYYRELAVSIGEEA